MRNRKGFTLIEVLVVIVILGVLAGLAIPVYTAQVERARAVEALDHLTSARASAVRYFGANNTYVGIAADMANLDYNPNLTVGGQTRLFDYAATNLAAATITITALRRVGVAGVADAGGTAANNNITVNQAGVVVRNGVYA